MNPYETDRLLSEYLLFHYGKPQEILADVMGMVSRGVIDFPVRCVRECLDGAELPPASRALDAGCAAGRSSFELARHCHEVIGIDFSRRFIEAASQLQRDGRLEFERIDEGRLSTSCVAEVPAEIDRTRVTFETGDATNLRPDLGSYDVILAANLLCRLRDPRRFLDRTRDLVRPGGRLILTTPCTWLEEFTPVENWLGGLMRHGQSMTTLDGLHEALEPDFELRAQKDLPFLIREHRRKYQLSSALATVWTRRWQ